MKSCPECNRTYADETLTFCLADGSLLSAPYDPQATQHLPAHSSEPPPTEVMYPAPNSASLPPTQQSKEATSVMPTLTSSIPSNVMKQESSPVSPALQKSNRSPWIIGSIVVLIIVAAIAFIANRNSTAPSSLGVTTQSPTPNPSKNKLVEMQTDLDNAITYAQRKEYEPARITASDFFSTLKKELEKGDNSTLTKEQREGLMPLLAEHEKIITLIARSDPASVKLLSNLNVKYRKAIGGDDK